MNEQVHRPFTASLLSKPGFLDLSCLSYLSFAHQTYPNKFDSEKRAKHARLLAHFIHKSLIMWWSRNSKAAPGQCPGIFFQLENFCGLKLMTHLRWCENLLGPVSYFYPPSPILWQQQNTEDYRDVLIDHCHIILSYFLPFYSPRIWCLAWPNAGTKRVIGSDEHIFQVETTKLIYTLQLGPKDNITFIWLSD